jgi:REP element-mobilizing transposase RayT
MIRGVNRGLLFACSADYEDFLARFAFLVRELGFVVLAWCLLGNHAHFVLRSSGVKLEVLMQRLNSRHALRFNRLYDRVGHLFQDRYKAVRITTEAGLARCSAYVTGNALRHRVTLPRNAGAYAWCGYPALIGKAKPREFESLDETAKALGVARDDFVDFILQEAMAPGGFGAGFEPDQIDELNRLIVESCARHGVDATRLGAKRPAARLAKAEICEKAAASLSLPLTAVARQVGISYREAEFLVGRPGRRR